MQRPLGAILNSTIYNHHGEIAWADFRRLLDCRDEALQAKAVGMADSEFTFVGFGIGEGCSAGFVNRLKQVVGSELQLVTIIWACTSDSCTRLYKRKVLAQVEDTEQRWPSPSYLRWPLEFRCGITA